MADEDEDYEDRRYLVQLVINVGAYETDPETVIRKIVHNYISSIEDEEIEDREGDVYPVNIVGIKSIQRVK